MPRLKNFWSEIATPRSANTSQESSSAGDNKSLGFEDAMSIDGMSSVHSDSIFTSNSGIEKAAVETGNSRKPIAQFLPPMMLQGAGDYDIRDDTMSDDSSFAAILGVHHSPISHHKNRSAGTFQASREAANAERAVPTVEKAETGKKSFLLRAPRPLRIMAVMSLLIILFATVIILLVVMSNNKDEGQKEASSLTFDERNEFLSSNQETPSPVSTPSPVDTPSPTDQTPSPTANVVSSFNSNGSSDPTSAPSQTPTRGPVPAPSPSPTPAPSPAPSPTPTPAPSTAPSSEPSPAPTAKPSPTPTKKPSLAPTLSPTLSPTLTPTMSPQFETRAPTDEVNRKHIKKTKAPTALETRAPSTEDRHRRRRWR